MKTHAAKSYEWAAPGDVNAFFGLMLDNTADLVLMVGLMSSAFNFPATFALRYMIPGTALGVLAGDLMFTWMAFRLAQKTSCKSITAMPLGLDTPSTFGMVFFVLGPAFLAAKDAGMAPEAAAWHTWQVGVCAILASGVFKLFCALGSSWVRRIVPRAGLLGSLAAIALVLIAFLPLIEILHYPVAGFVSLGIILTTLVARVELPGRVPGALAALLVGGAIFYAMRALGLNQPAPLPIEPADALWPSEWLRSFEFSWIAAWQDSLKYLPVVIPFALATVVGGIDCTESAAAAGDEYSTGQVIAVEAVATILAGLCGGVIQTTPYIGHPAYKAMGGRAAYTLATAAVIGGAGVFGLFGYFYVLIPKAAVFPILMFVGLEIAAQSFSATPRRHYPAVALACTPALASLIVIFTDQVLAAGQLSIAALEQNPATALLAKNLLTLRILSAGFIVTSLIWAAMLAMLIDRRFRHAAAFAATGAAACLLGVIHSPLQGSPLALAWALPESLPASAAGQSPLTFASAYGMLAAFLLAWGYWRERKAARMLKRVLEPEVMDSPQEAADYDAMDHLAVNRAFVADFLAAAKSADINLAAPGTRMLDLGAGTAQIPIELVRQEPRARVLAIDLAASMLELARRNVAAAEMENKIELDQVDAKRLPYADGQFAAAISNSIVHHIPEPAVALAEACRVVRSGGLVFVRDLLRPHSDAEVKSLVNAYASEANERQRQLFDASLRAALSLDEIRETVVRLGFDPDTVRQTSDRHWTWIAQQP